MRSITSGSIACGFHAGDPSVMRQTVRLAARAGVAIGAHPGFPDLVGFGPPRNQRRAAGNFDFVLYQIGALGAVAKAEGVRLQHVKPHGALYNMSARRKDVAEAIARAVASFDETLMLVGLPESELLSAGSRLGLRVACRSVCGSIVRARRHADAETPGRFGAERTRPRRGARRPDGSRSQGRRARRHIAGPAGRHDLRSWRYAGCAGLAAAGSSGARTGGDYSRRLARPLNQLRLCPSAALRNTLPAIVLGRLSRNSICAGTLNGASFERQYARSSSAVTFDPGRRTTHAFTASLDLVRDSATPTSMTAG